MARRNRISLKLLALLILIVYSFTAETTASKSSKDTESRFTLFEIRTNPQADGGINYTIGGGNATIDNSLWGTVNYPEGRVPTGYYQPGSRVEIQFEAFNYNRTNETELHFTLAEIKPEAKAIVNETSYAHTWLYNVSWAFTLPEESPALYMLNITARSLPGQVYVGSIRSFITVPGQEIEGSLELLIKPGSQRAYSLTIRNTGENVWTFNPYDYHLDKFGLTQWNRVQFPWGILMPMMYMVPGNFTEDIRLPELSSGRYRVSLDVTALGGAGSRTLYYEFSVQGGETDTLLFDALPVVVSLILIVASALFLRKRARILG